MTNILNDEVILTDNGEVPTGPSTMDLLAEKDATIHRQEIAVAVLRQRLIEVELELVNSRCELVARDNPR